MGMIYKRKYKRKDGTMAEAAVWWIKYYRDGVPMRESTESDKESVAKKLLKQREGDIVRGVPVTPQTNRATFDELMADVLNDYKVNGKRSLETVTYHFAHLTAFFTERRAASINVADVREYVAQRQAEHAKNATINRELTVLKRAFSLGIDGGKITQKPKITMLRENNTRKGFFERELFETVRRHLLEGNQPVATFAYITGWRVQSEVLPLRWAQVDFEAGTVRLDPGTTKNGEARIFRMTAELRAVLEAQWAYTETVQRKRGMIVRSVFHRNGELMSGFRRNWKTACKRAGCPGMIQHDFRRTAVRNMVRAGIAERVAMQMTGHKTRSVFERYNIVSEGDLVDAANKLDAFAAGTVTGTVAAKSTSDGSSS
jgi:integrase